MFKKLWILPFCVLLAACDSKNDERESAASSLATQTLGGDLASLLPADANVLVFVRSLEKTDAMFRTVGELMEEQLPFSPSALIQQMTQVDPATLDPGRPIAIAVKVVRMGMMPQPIVTFVLPVKDPAAVARASGLPAKEVGDGYVALSQDEQYAAAGSKLANALPEGDFVIRADLAAMVTLYRNEIDSGLMMGEGFAQGQLANQMPGADVAAMAGKFFGFTKDIINSAEYLDVSLTDRDPTMVTDMVFTAKDGSPLGNLKSETNLVDLVDHLPANHETTVLFKWNIAGMQDWVTSLTEYAAKELKVADANTMNAMAKEMKALVKGLGSDFAFSYKSRDDGPQMVMAARAQDAPSFVGRYVGFMAKYASMGAAWKAGKTTEAAGATVHNGFIQFADKEANKFFGEDGLAISMAGKGDRIVGAAGSGGATSVEAALGRNERNAGLAAALDEANGRLGFLFQTDARALMRDLANMLRAKGERAPKIPDGAAVPIMVFGTRNTRAFRIGVRFDPAPLKVLIKEVDGPMDK